MYEYVIWSFEHEAWRGPDHRGYVLDLKDAGRYSAQDAGEIVTSSVMLDEVAIVAQLAEMHGAPEYHPYHGELFAGKWL